jgi:hypothetical protein
MKIAAFIDFQGTKSGKGIDYIRSPELYTFSIDAIKRLNDRR